MTSHLTSKGGGAESSILFTFFNNISQINCSIFKIIRYEENLDSKLYFCYLLAWPEYFFFPQSFFFKSGTRVFIIDKKKSSPWSYLVNGCSLMSPTKKQNSTEGHQCLCIVCYLRSNLVFFRFLKLQTFLFVIAQSIYFFRVYVLESNNMMIFYLYWLNVRFMIRLYIHVNVVIQ